MIVVLILIVMAIAICTIVYIITDNSETLNVDSNFAANAKKVTDTFMSIAEQKIGAAGAMVVAIVAHSIDHTRE